MRLAAAERRIGYLSIPLFFGLWYAVSMAGLVNARLFPPPTRVAADLWQSATSGPLFIDLAMSASRVAVGYVAGAAAGILLGLLTGRIRIIDRLLAPVFQMLRPIPPIALVPIVILWFGLSELGKCFLVFCACSSPCGWRPTWESGASTSGCCGRRARSAPPSAT